MLETNSASHEENNILVTYWQSPPSEDFPVPTSPGCAQQWHANVNVAEHKH